MADGRQIVDLEAGLAELGEVEARLAQVEAALAGLGGGGGGGPTVTASPFAGGPPAAPANGDEWVATGVDARGRSWLFRFNAASASAFKWEFIGGPELVIVGSFGPELASGVWTRVSQNVALARSGDYLVKGECAIDGTDAAGYHAFAGVGIGGGGDDPPGNSGTSYQGRVALVDARQIGSCSAERVVTAAADDNVAAYLWADSVANTPIVTALVSVSPVRVS